MNALETIVSTVATVLPDYQVYAGFGADIDAWLAENVGAVRTGMVFVSVQGDEVIDQSEDGKATRLRSSFALWIKRISYNREDAGAAYAEYMALRDALNGVEFDGGTLQLSGGLPAIGAGYVNSQIQLEADVYI